MAEFGLIELIQSHFANRNEGVTLGIGDDAALVDVPDHESLVISTDTLNSGVHFLPGCAPEKLAHKALAVNLSDLASMGAKPRWFLLNLSLPEADEAWVSRFLAGMDPLVDRHQISLIGGDTCQGPLSVSITALGTVDQGSGLKRSGAQEGDLVCVSGLLGDAALALKLLKEGKQPGPELIAALELPSPRVELGRSLRGIARSCIDISDGLLADLGHISTQSECGATIYAEKLPGSPALMSLCPEERLNLQLGGGDDYELCFTLPREAQGCLNTLSGELGLPISVIGSMTGGTGLSCLGADGMPVKTKITGYSHFGPSEQEHRN